MWFLMIGVVLGLCKYLEIGPAVGLAWWQVGIPFGLAVAWWSWADNTGYTKKKAMEKENLKKKARVEKNREALGMSPGTGKKK